MKYANQYGYSDVEPFEVIKKISDITMEIRAMDAEQINAKEMAFVAGGFSHICTNQYAQEWDIKSNPENPTIRIRYSKAKQRWQDKNGRRYKLSDKPNKFYDFNF